MAIKTFTTGEVLTASDTNTYLANSGLVYIKQQTVGTTVSSVTVSNAFSATYDNYKIIYSGGTASSLNTLGMTIGGSSTGYYSIVHYSTYGSPSTFLGEGNNNTASWSYVGYGSANYTSVSIDLINPFAALFTTYGAGAWPAVTVSGTSAGIHQVATSYTSFAITSVSGTISGGTIYVYGYRKS